MPKITHRYFIPASGRPIPGGGAVEGRRPYSIGLLLKRKSIRRDISPAHYNSFWNRVSVLGVHSPVAGLLSFCSIISRVLTCSFIIDGRICCGLSSPDRRTRSTHSVSSMMTRLFEGLHAGLRLHLFLPLPSATLLLLALSSSHAPAPPARQNLLSLYEERHAVSAAQGHSTACHIE